MVQVFQVACLAKLGKTVDPAYLRQMSKIELVIKGREKDLGGFSVRRVLPFASHRMVGPFIFFDHMGPADFQPQDAMEVRPHPHIGLATVTYLFEGKIRHRDSLGSDQLIEPGAINWMTAGRGIVHSERTPDDLKNKARRLNGIQCWVALPLAHEQAEPSFIHYPASAIPEFNIGYVKLRLLIGTILTRHSPVKTHSDLFYIEARMPAGSTLDLPVNGREAAAYVVDGEVEIAGQTLQPFSMAVVKTGDDLSVRATQDSRLMILGGKSVGERYMFWNFVASSQEKLEAAKKEWAKGPGLGGFPRVPGDEQEFTPLPAN